uniref:Putative ovule protein n=1 Tax=Solanum chacoense TaxID=4108 RepID=A0A0V0H3J9_SOLCH
MQKKIHTEKGPNFLKKNQTYTEKSPKNQEMLFSNCCQSATLDNTLNQKSECSTSSLSGKKTFFFY